MIVINCAGGTPDVPVAKACLLIQVENNRSLPRRRQPQNLNLFKFKLSVEELNGNDSVHISSSRGEAHLGLRKAGPQEWQLIRFQITGTLHTALQIADPQNECVPPELADFVNYFKPIRKTKEIR